MSDDETKRLLGEMLEVQQQQLTLLTRITEHQSRVAGASTGSDAAYRKELDEWHSLHSKSYWIAAVHTVTKAAIVGLLICVVVHLLRSH